MQIDRRRFLQLAGGATAATAMAGGFADSIARAAAHPRPPRPGHHRGRRAHRRPDAGEPLLRPLLRHACAACAASATRTRRCCRSGKPVWHQPTTATRGRAAAVPPDGRRPRRGVPDRACRTRGPTGTRRSTAATTTGGCRRRARRRWRTCSAQDTPFHYALADAFTVCDAYHCSFIGNTDPNRYYMWTGWTGNDGTGGGPVLVQRRARLRLDDLPRAPGGGRHLVEGVPGHRLGPGRRGLLGLGRRPVHRQLRRQLAAVLQHVPQRPARRSAVREGPDRHEQQGRRRTTSRSSPPTSRPAGCRRSATSPRPRRSASTRTGRPTTAPGTSPRSSTR